MSNHATHLAVEYGVVAAANLEPLTRAAKTKLNQTLRGLEPDEREALVLLNACGSRDWDMVDGTRRVWHFTATGRVGWNDVGDNELERVIASAERLLGRPIEGT